MFFLEDPCNELSRTCTLSDRLIEHTCPFIDDPGIIRAEGRSTFQSKMFAGLNFHLAVPTRTPRFSQYLIFLTYGIIKQLYYIRWWVNSIINLSKYNIRVTRGMWGIHPNNYNSCTHAVLSYRNCPGVGPTHSYRRTQSIQNRSTNFSRDYIYFMCKRKRDI